MKHLPENVVGFGEILWDIFPDGRQLGGAPANFVWHSHLLKVNACLVSAVGNDLPGKEIVQKAAQLGISQKYLFTVADKPTGTVEVHLDSKGHAGYTIHENVAWDYIPWASKLKTLARQADAVCFGSLCQRSAISRATIQMFLSNTRPQCLRIFDINLRQSYFSEAIIRHSLLIANVLKLNDEELIILTELFGLSGSTLNKLKQLLDLFGLNCIALTRGAEGSLMITPEELSDLPGETIAVKDTVGAGDAFTAAIAIGILRNMPLKQTHYLASRIASYVCSQPGATPILPQSMVQDFYSSPKSTRYPAIAPVDPNPVE